MKENELDHYDGVKKALKEFEKININIDQREALIRLEKAIENNTLHNNEKKESALDALNEVAPKTSIVLNITKVLTEKNRYPFICDTIKQYTSQRLKSALQAFEGNNNNNDETDRLAYLEEAIQENDEQSLLECLKEVALETNVLNIIKALGKKGEYPGITGMIKLALKHKREIPQDYKETVKYYTQLAKFNDTEALYQLGHFYHDGIGIKKDEEMILKCWSVAGDQNHKEAIESIVKYYDNKWGKKEEKLEWAKKGAELGSGYCYHILSEAHLNLSTPELNSKAIYYHNKAEELGYTVSREKWTEKLKDLSNQSKINIYEKQIKNGKEKIDNAIADNASPVEKCLHYLQTIETASFTNQFECKRAFQNFIYHMKKPELLDMLVNLPHIGLGTSIMNSVLFNALCEHPDENVSKQVSSPLVKKVEGKEQTKPIKVYNSYCYENYKNVEHIDPYSYKEHTSIPIILKEALEIASEREKNLFNAVEFIGQWQNEVEYKKDGNLVKSIVNIPIGVQQKIAGYFPSTTLKLSDLESEATKNGLSERRELYGFLSDQVPNISNEPEYNNQGEKNPKREEGFKTWGKKIYGEGEGKIKPNIQSTVEEILQLQQKTITTGELNKKHFEFVSKRYPSYSQKDPQKNDRCGIF